MSADLTSDSTHVVAERPVVQDAVALAINSVSGRIYRVQRQIFSDRILQDDIDGRNVQAIIDFVDVATGVASFLGQTDDCQKVCP